MPAGAQAGDTIERDPGTLRKPPIQQIVQGGHSQSLGRTPTIQRVELDMDDLRLKPFVAGLPADPAAGIRHFAPHAPNISVRNFISTSLGEAFPPWSPASLLANAVYAAGFIYDPAQNIIYSRMDALQRQFGYAYGYDAAAIGMNAILDCEPIFFDYAGKHWMIELWKGQYGLETGCEIGIYNRQIGSTSPGYALLDATVGARPGDSNQSHNLFFDCAKDDERLVVSSVLHKNGHVLFFRGPAKHWWLTGFKWGIYSRPQELTMDVSITCLDVAMRTALVDALEGMGYSVDVSSGTVSFEFTTPSSHQPRSDIPSVVQAVELADQGIVDGYDALQFPSDDPNAIPDTSLATIMDSVGIYSPDFFINAVTNLASIGAAEVRSIFSAINS
jgi:hypothetical protein